MASENGRTPQAVEREVGGVGAFWWDAPGPDPPVLYLHGVPTHSDDFLPFLKRTGGLAPDLPGFGRSGKPLDFAYSADGYADWLERLLQEEAVDRFSLVVHDWGAVGLALAQRMPERVERLVVVDAVPLLAGYSWHRWARIWQRPFVGEIAMGLTFRRTARRALAEGTTGADELIDRAWPHFDHGTQRAILRLYRWGRPETIAAAGERLGELRCPTLVLWGEDDPWVPPEFAGRYAEALGGPVRVEIVEGAGHWPWIERPEVIDTVSDFLLADAA